MPDRPTSKPRVDKLRAAREAKGIVRTEVYVHHTRVAEIREIAAHMQEPKE